MEAIVVQLSNKTLVVAVLEEVGHDSLCQHIRVPCFIAIARGSDKQKQIIKTHTRVIKQNMEKGKSICPFGGRPHENRHCCCFHKNQQLYMNKQTTIEGTRRLWLHVMQSALAGLLTIM